MKRSLLLGAVGALALAGTSNLQAQEEPVSPRIVTGTLSLPATGIALVGVNGFSSLTFGDVVGTTPGSFETGNFSAANADVILYTTGGVQKRAYYEAGATPNGWKEVGNAFGPAVDGDVLDANTGIVITRASGASAIDFTPYSFDVAVGTDTTITIAAGLGIYAWPRAVDVTLDDTGLDAVLTQGSFSAANADLVRLDSDGDGALESYYYEASAGTPGWKLVGNAFGAPVGSSVTIPALVGFVIERKTGATSLTVE